MTRATGSVLIRISALIVSVTAIAVASGQQPDVPSPRVVTSHSTGTIAVSIPDANPAGVEVPLTVSNVETLTDVNVSFRINHTFDGDLQISLVHPDTTVIPLVTNRGGSGQNFGTGANGSTGTPTVIDDAATAAVSAGVPPFAGSFRPESPLSALNGKPANGIWKLRIVDTAALDVGIVGVFNLQLTLLCACVEIAAAPPLLISSEGLSPPNNAPDPNETLTVYLPLVNTGAVSTSNLVATLQATGGVVNPSGPQNYGVVTGGGASVSRPYTFTAGGACGSFITLTLALQDGATSLGTIEYTLMTGAPFTPTTFTNPGAILVPGTGLSGVASPYPSNIVVSGLGGTIVKLTVGLNLVNHTFPDDFDVLLVSPGGVKMIIWSDSGGSADAVNVNLTLDDAAAGTIPDAGPVVSGTYRPSNAVAGDAFAAPAPAGPYLSPGPVGPDTFASAFNGLSANGTWSLYATDDVGGDAGNINGGWQLSITRSGASCLTATVPTAPTGVAAAGRFEKAHVSFNASASSGGSAITGYTVISTPAGGVDSDAGSTGLLHVITGLTNGTPYTFRVRATNVVGNSALSLPSNSVTPPGFTDYPLQAGVTPVKAVHITELRQRIDLQRVRFGLLAFSWTNPTLTPGTTVIQAVHITDLRTALQQAYVAGGFTSMPSYTDPSLGPGTPVKMAHISQLQFFVMAIE